MRSRLHGGYRMDMKSTEFFFFLLDFWRVSNGIYGCETKQLTNGCKIAVTSPRC